ncbi:ABC transporter permease [Streptomonospora nanhaiensis]|uniref:ABC-2 type transport system permease protein n=1 Tax=Streptomonospora nanhaiensis TaxID=1323731 RepID=A0A853BUP4_9ACTN|nr:ABC transporter permease [Streptomonospora nanhaiensis]NYI98700.1 ABC-2 type transport system permease protein [Streptomonospora nanhaiensis]
MTESAAPARTAAGRPTAPAPAPPPRTRAFGRAVAMEWTKLASVRTTWWCLGLGFAVMIAFGLLMGFSAADRIADDPASAGTFSYSQVTSQGVFYLVQFIVLILSALAATNEYANRGITTTLLAVPQRGRVLAARALVTAGLGFVAGAVTTALGIGAVWTVIGAHAPLRAGYALGTVGGSGLCMALFAVLFVGLGTALRGTAGTIGLGFLLLLGVPLVLQLSGVQALNDMAAYFPGIAGIEFYAAGDVGFYTAPHDGPINLAVVVGWAAAAMIVGWTELRLRDV